jgi:AraC family transcriptional regulator, transcriptional activator of pobA
MSPASDQTVIQFYNLFGELGDLPDVVHCETIAARSVLHAWKLSAHRHARLHQVLLIERGGGHATLDGQICELKPMQVVNVAVNHVHSFSFLPGTQGLVVTLAIEILDQIQHDAAGLGDVLKRSAVVRCSGDIRRAMHKISDEHSQRNFARAHVLQSLTGLLLGLIARTLIGKSGARDNKAVEGGLFKRFESLLEERYKEPWTVSQYASRLSITPTHLSRICRSATGLPASKLILNRLVREARRYLVYTNMPISAIAYELGFKDPAYFTRIYAGATGLSPRTFRIQVQNSSKYSASEMGKARLTR